MRFLPWPSKAERRARVAAAREAYDRTVRERQEVEAIVDRLHNLQEDDRFRKAFGAALGRGT